MEAGEGWCRSRSQRAEVCRSIAGPEPGRNAPRRHTPGPLRLIMFVRPSSGGRVVHFTPWAGHTDWRFGPDGPSSTQFSGSLRLTTAQDLSPARRMPIAASVSA